MIRKKKIQKLGIILIVLLLFGCAEADVKMNINSYIAGQEGYKTIIDDYARIVLQQDRDSLEYEQALAQVGVYLEQLDAKSLKTARTKVQSVIRWMENEAESLIAYTPEDGFSELLKEYGIDYEEYIMNADARSQDLYDYIRILESLDEYLSYEEIDDFSRGALQHVYEMTVRTQEIMKKYNYYGINYWFAEWKEEAVAYIKQQILDKLTSFSVKEAVWEDSREGVERRMEMYLNQLEKLNEEWAEYLGEYQERVYQMQQENN